MTKMKKSDGASMNQAAAKRKGTGDWVRAERTSAGSVRSRRVRITAAKTSFQERTKVKIEAAASPGSASGMTTRMKALTGVQPSVSAASSRSRGTLTKMLLVIRTVKGRASAVCIRATLQTVS